MRAIKRIFLQARRTAQLGHWKMGLRSRHPPGEFDHDSRVRRLSAGKSTGAGKPKKVLN
jgi:hypothetical protein